MRRWMSYFLSFVACSIMAVTSGCASGGFSLTRKWAQVVNGQPLILRIILYILTAVVFAITMLIDMVVLNTIDFWQGKVSAGEYNFNGQGKTYYVRHDFVPGTQLHHSIIRVSDEKSKALLQEVVLAETTKGDIEVYVDGSLRGRVHDIAKIPLVAFYDKSGKIIQDNVPVLTEASALAMH